MPREPMTDTRRTAACRIIKAVEFTCSIRRTRFAGTALFVEAACVRRDEIATAAAPDSARGRSVRNRREDALAFVVAERDLADAPGDAVGNAQAFHADVDAASLTVRTVIVDAATRTGNEDTAATEAIRPGPPVLERNTEKVRRLTAAAKRAERAITIADAPAHTFRLTDVGAALLASAAIAVEAAGSSGVRVSEEVNVSGRIGAAHATLDACSTGNVLGFTVPIGIAEAGFTFTVRDAILVHEAVQAGIGATEDGEALLLVALAEATKTAREVVVTAVRVAAALAVGDEGAVTAEPIIFIGIQGAVSKVHTGAAHAGRAETAVDTADRARAGGIRLAVEWSTIRTDAHLAEPGAQRRISDINALVLVCAAARVRYATGAGILAAVCRSQFVVAVEDAGAVDAALAVTAVLVAAAADPAIAKCAFAGAGVVLILADATCDVANLATEAARTAIQLAITVGNALIVDAYKATAAIVVIHAAACASR
jgi:hypothetical protein